MKTRTLLFALLIVFFIQLPIFGQNSSDSKNNNRAVETTSTTQTVKTKSTSPTVDFVEFENTKKTDLQILADSIIKLSPDIFRNKDVEIIPYSDSLLIISSNDPEYTKSIKEIALRSKNISDLSQTTASTPEIEPENNTNNSDENTDPELDHNYIEFSKITDDRLNCIIKKIQDLFPIDIFDEKIVLSSLQFDKHSMLIISGKDPDLTNKIKEIVKESGSFPEITQSNIKLARIDFEQIKDTDIDKLISAVSCLFKNKIGSGEIELKPLQINKFQKSTIVIIGNDEASVKEIKEIKSIISRIVKTDDVPKATAAPTSQFEVDYVEFKHLDDEKVKSLATSIEALFPTEILKKNDYSSPVQIRPFGKFILIITGKDEGLMSQIKKLVEDIKSKEDKGRDPKEKRQILFETSFITVNPTKIRNFANNIVTKYSGSETGRSHTLESTMDYGLADSFTNTVIWTFKQRNNTFNLTAGYILQHGLGTVISKPRIRVYEGETSTFKSTKSVPQQTTSNEGTNVTYKDTGIELTITAHSIIPCTTIDCTDDKIQAEIIVKDGSPSRSTNYELYLINELSVNGKYEFTNNKPTIVASLVKETENIIHFRKPLLSRIPLIGKAFTTKGFDNDRVETIVLIQPVIETPDSQLSYAYNYREAIKNGFVGIGFKQTEEDNYSKALSGQAWNSVPEIYEEEESEESKKGAYWNLRDKFIDADILNLATSFMNIRKRFEYYGQSEEQIKKEIMNDDFLCNEADDILNKFNQEIVKYHLNKCKTCTEYRIDKLFEPCTTSSLLDERKIFARYTKSISTTNKRCSQCNLSDKDYCEQCDASFGYKSETPAEYCYRIVSFDTKIINEICKNKPFDQCFEQQKSCETNYAEKVNDSESSQEICTSIYTGDKYVLDCIKKHDKEIVCNENELTGKIPKCASCEGPVTKRANYNDLLIAAAHWGVINKKAYDIYKEKFKICEAPKSESSTEKEAEKSAK